MKNSNLLVGALFFLGFCNVSVANERRECSKPLKKFDLDVHLDISLSKAKMGTVLPARVVIRNKGASDIKLPTLLVAEDYWLKFKITDKNGSVSRFIGPESNYSYSEERLILEPGYLYGVEVRDISKLYLIDRPGKYSIYVEYGRSPTGQCELGLHRSNSVDLVLTP